MMMGIPSPESERSNLRIAARRNEPGTVECAGILWPLPGPVKAEAGAAGAVLLLLDPLRVGAPRVVVLEAHLLAQHCYRALLVRRVVQPAHRVHVGAHEPPQRLRVGLGPAARDGQHLELVLGYRLAHL